MSLPQGDNAVSLHTWTAEAWGEDTPLSPDLFFQIYFCLFTFGAEFSHPVTQEGKQLFAFRAWAMENVPAHDPWGPSQPNQCGIPWFYVFY